MHEFTVAACQEYTVGLFTPEDALGVSRLTYTVYADAHPFDYLYDPAEVARLFTSGSQHAMIARSPSGEVLGMMGISRCSPWHRLYELVLLMVLPNQRGKGMAVDIWNHTLDRLPDMAGAGAIFGEAVCTHTFSQQMCRESGLLPCGIMLDAVPSKAYATNHEGPARTALVLTMKPLEKIALTVAVPHWCRAQFDILCDRMSLVRTVSALGPGELAEHSDIEAAHYDKVDFVKLLVRRAGRDLGRFVAEKERAAGEQGIVQVAFNLGEATSAAGIEALKGRGYFFGGFLPFWFGDSDALVLQRRKDPPDFDTLKLLDDGPAYLVDLMRRDATAALAHWKNWGIY
jgi:hypothetical protein